MPCLSHSSIVITGVGVISPIGNDLATYKDNLFAGRGGIDRISFPYQDREISFPAAAVKNFDPEQYITAKELPMFDRFSQFAVAAAKQAFLDSCLTLDEEAAQRTGVITGTGVGGQGTLEESYIRLLDPKGPPRVHPFTIPRLMVNAGSSHISMALGIKGPSFTVASACASALHAMAVTISMLRSGLIDRAITGGTEACLTFGTLKGWEALRVMAPDVCRPFSANREGMVLGEGAAMFVLETLESAKARGAKIYAALTGFGMSADAKDLTSPDTIGARRAILSALKDAGLNPEDIDYINAHGTGTRINDVAETAAIKQALGDHAYKVAISSSKSLFGHALGAAGALEMVATILAVQNDRAPPTINYIGKDDDCDLNYTPNVARDVPIRRALNNAFAFGGLNAVIVVEKV